MLQRNKTVLSLLLAAACAAPAYAVFEDIPAGSRQLGFGASGAALDDALGFWGNPALAGYNRKFSAGGSFLSSKRLPNASADLRSYGVWGVVPRMSYGRMGTLAFGGQYRSDGNGDLTQKTFYFGWGSYNLFRGDAGILDLGAALKVLKTSSPGGEAGSGAGLDLGAVFRPDDSHAVGFSILNLNNPSFKLGTAEDNAPRVIKLGVSERRDDFTLSLDLSDRSASYGRPGNVSLTPGVEYVWRTERSGLFFSRSGLNLAERASALSGGIGWRHLASEISYSVAVPLTGTIVPAHSVTLALRFGDRDIEGEYERLIKQEIKYRKDLVEALDESARREGLLKQELVSMKAEIDSLNSQLKDTQEARAASAAEKERLAAVVKRQAAAEAELKAMAAKRAADKLNQLKYDFSVDWQAYLKLKGGGAPADVLKSSLQRMISQYQNSGIDISQATVELQTLVR